MPLLFFRQSPKKFTSPPNLFNRKIIFLRRNPHKKHFTCITRISCIFCAIRCTTLHGARNALKLPMGGFHCATNGPPRTSVPTTKRSAGATRKFQNSSKPCRLPSPAASASLAFLREEGAECIRGGRSLRNFELRLKLLPTHSPSVTHSRATSLRREASVTFATNPRPTNEQRTNKKRPPNQLFEGF